jgi:EAL domain-containing protein (putative c-di-GMP-specific phosphodiesterase class I)
LDDFGAGYAGVRYLREFRFDRLKIDRSFIHDLSSNADEVQMVKAIVRLARALKMETVAEGIEDRITCDLLLQIGCVVGQGYFFAKPHPAAETEHYFRDNESRLIA